MSSARYVHLIALHWGQPSESGNPKLVALRYPDMDLLRKPTPRRGLYKRIHKLLLLIGQDPERSWPKGGGRASIFSTIAVPNKIPTNPLP